MKWEQGRQNSGYFKKKLWESSRFLFDIYLLKFPEGSEVPGHTDPVKPGYQHHRINIMYVKPDEGGHMWIQGINHFVGPIVKFRPDLVKHGMSPVIKGQAYILSIGWLKREEDSFNEYEPVW